MAFHDAISLFHKIPKLGLGMYPTPVEEMPRLRAALGPNAPRLFAMRDDYTGPGLGGNKVRKLEYVLARAKNDGADTVLTVGNIRSNHARVTAALAAHLGLECHLILNGKAQEIPASQFVETVFGAVIHPVATPQIRVSTMQRIAEDLRAAGKKAVEIPLGASDALGAMGYVSAAEEIGHKHYDAIFVSSSSGGTQAGLDAGLQLFGNPSRLIGVSPDDPAASICEHMMEIRTGIERLLSMDADVLARPLEVDDDFVGEGYGIPTSESEEALKLVARTEGMLLDPTYTSKTMASLIARVRRGEFTAGQAVLFIHTGGQLGLFSLRRDFEGRF